MRIACQFLKQTLPLRMLLQSPESAVVPHIRAEANGLTNAHVKRDAMQEYYLRYTNVSCRLRDTT